MKEDIENGWHDVHKGFYQWKCPYCKEHSPTEDWVSRDVGCEDCGSHDGRICPKCHVEFDHVWGAIAIAKEQEQ